MNDTCILWPLPGGGAIIAGTSWLKFTRDGELLLRCNTGTALADLQQLIVLALCNSVQDVRREHAGSGITITSLRAGKMQLAFASTSLLCDHCELADVGRWLLYCRTGTLATVSSDDTGKIRVTPGDEWHVETGDGTLVIAADERLRRAIGAALSGHDGTWHGDGASIRLETGGAVCDLHITAGGRPESTLTMLRSSLAARHHEWRINQ